MSLTLTDEQRAAQATVLARRAAGHREAVVTGFAGTGKTTLLKSMIGRLGKGAVVLGTPTGRARKRLQSVTGHDAKTLHGLLYFGPDEDEDEDDDAVLLRSKRKGAKRPKRPISFSNPRPPCGPGQTLVVDEAGMVGTALYRHVMQMLPPGAFVMWNGDPEQLEPVNDTWGPDLLNPHAELTQVHRQAADSPIVGYATATRRGQGALWRNEWDNRDDRLVLGRADLDRAVEWAAERIDAGVDSTLLTWMHRVREQLNAGIRRRMGLRGRLAPGDRIVVRMNSAPLEVVNGEVLTVTRVTPSVRRGREAWAVETEEVDGVVYVICDFLNDRSGDVWKMRKKMGFGRWDDLRIIHAWNGQCLTVHLGQGSEWDEVGWVFGRGLVRMARSETDSARRLAYTAITRAAKSLRVFDVR